MSTLQIKRGTKANLPASMADGELAIVKDIGELWYGTGAGRQEVSYVHLNKDETIAGNKTFSGTTTLPATTSVGTVTSAELGRLSGVTSGIQGQLDARATKDNPLLTGNVTVGSNVVLTGTQAATAGVPLGSSQSYNGEFTMYPGNNAGKLNIMYWNSSAYKNALNLSCVASGYSNLLLMKDGGFVGINKAVPTVALDINGAVKATDFVNSSFASKINPTFAGRLTSPALTINRDDGSQAILSITCTEATGVTTATGKNSGIWCNVIDCQNSNLMITTLANGGTGGKILLDGSVGIGKTPTYKLDVDGTIFASSTTNTITGGFGGNGGTSLVGLGNTSGTPTIQGYNANFAGTANVAIQPVGGNTGMGVVNPKATVHGGGSTILGGEESPNGNNDIGNGQWKPRYDTATKRLYFSARGTDGVIAGGGYIQLS